MNTVIDSSDPSLQQQAKDFALQHKGMPYQALKQLFFDRVSADTNLLAQHDGEAWKVRKEAKSLIWRAYYNVNSGRCHNPPRGIEVLRKTC